MGKVKILLSYACTVFHDMNLLFETKSMTVLVIVCLEMISISVQCK